MSFIKRLCTAAVVLAATAGPAAADVTLINVFEVPDGRLETVVEAWEAARDFLSREPGYVATALHRSLQPDDRFRLINIAVWESPEAFAAAIARMRAAGVFPRIEGLGVNPALYTVIRTDACGPADRRWFGRGRPSPGFRGIEACNLLEGRCIEPGEREPEG